MSFIQVNYGAMDAGVQQIRSSFSRLQAMFEDLQSQVNQLSSTWDGASKEAYLSVQQVRMGDRLEVAVDVPPRLAAASFPPMMLVTLVENAIKHGLAPLPEGG